MKVILKQDVKGTGKAGELVEVSDGFAKNFLIKRGVAVEASAAALNEKKTKDEAIAHHAKEELDAAKAIASKLDGKKITLKAKAGANGKLFGSITSKEIAEELSKAYNVEINKKKVSLKNDIKAFGSYEAEIKLHTGVVAKVTVSVEE